MTSSTLIFAIMVLGLVEPAWGNDAPLYFRPVNGVPTPKDQPFFEIVPRKQIDSANDALRQLDVGGGSGSLPANLPPRFTETITTPSTTGMTVAHAYLGQFIDHDLTRMRTVFDSVLIDPMVYSAGIIGDHFQNRRTPGFDLDSVYRITPQDFPSTDDFLGPWDISNLRFRRLVAAHGAHDFVRGPAGTAIIGDDRNDITGLIGYIHRAFMALHNKQVDRILDRDSIVEADITFESQQWWDIFNEARNYTTAYYQGIVCNEFVRQLTGRTLFEAMADTVEPLGSIVAPNAMIEFAGGCFRLHTLIPASVEIRPGVVVSPISEQLRQRVHWKLLVGPDAQPAGRIDAAVAQPLREIFDLMIPGNPFTVTLDLVQVNLLRGRELKLPSGEEYLAFLMNELGHDPKTTTTIRGKQMLDSNSAATFLDPKLDADLLADLTAGDTDLWAYIQIEAELNGGVLGPVGQDIIERSWAALLLADDWSILGKHNDQFTVGQMDFFRSATFQRLIDDILLDADVNTDEFVDVMDLLLVLAHWGETSKPPSPPLPPLIGDVDGDGLVGMSDLELIIDQWGL